MKHVETKIGQTVASGQGCSSLIRLIADHEPVVGEFDVVGQRAGLAGVEDVVVEVGKISLPRLEVLNVTESLFEVEMRRVRLDADAVEHQNIKPAEPVKRFLGDGLEVGGVGKIIEPIGDHRQLAVDDLKRRHLDLADTERRAVEDRMRDKLRKPAAQMGRLKNVLKYPAKVGPGDVIGKDRHWAVAKIERPDVIKAKDMIDVAMRYQHGIEPPDICSQGLLAKVRRGVNKDRNALVFDQNRDAEPLIPRVFGKTRLAVTGDGGYARRGSGAEEGKSHLDFNAETARPAEVLRIPRAFAFQLFLSENIRAGKLLRRLRLQLLFGRPHHRHILHPKIGQKPFEQPSLLLVQIALCLIADHCKHVEPILARIKVKRPLSRGGMRHGTKRCGGVGSEGREKIDKARRVIRTRDLFAVILGLVDSGGDRLLFDRSDRRLGLRFGSRGGSFWRFRLDLHALFQRSVRIKFPTISDLKGNVFLIFFVSDHNFFTPYDFITYDFLAESSEARFRLTGRTSASRKGLSGHALDFRHVLNLNGDMSEKFDELVGVMERLRAPGGCPWDAEQTYASLSQYLLEEAYETFDAIQHADATGDTEHLKEELGDLLLQVVFHSTIGKERGEFTIEDVAEGVARKLVLRHPHVFGDANLETASDVLNNWDELKANERKASGKVEKAKGSILEDVPVHFPALLEALKLTKKAAKVGFDWPDADQIFEKAEEEIGELRAAVNSNDHENIEEEIGDLLFVIVNLARRLDVEPETALKRTNRKFRKRFLYVEEQIKDSGNELDGSTLEEMDRLWNEAKSK